MRALVAGLLVLGATCVRAEVPAAWIAQTRVGEMPLYAEPMGRIETETWKGDSFQGLEVGNVTLPTLTPFLPPADRATGAAVVVAPGGGNLFLALGNEGVPVARWLQERGVAAFVVKYRTVPMPSDPKAYAAKVQAMLAPLAKSGFTAPLEGEAPAKADVLQALRLVKARAAEFGVDPERVGVLGFSAGSIAGLNATLAADASARPAFAGLIYGRMVAVKPPAAPPPLFVAIAADDPLFGRQGIGLVESWRDAGGRAELHQYQAGGHGFGLKRQGLTSDGWIAAFHAWLEANEFLKGR
jgi:acetyl esterase/lipase